MQKLAPALAAAWLCAGRANADEHIAFPPVTTNNTLPEKMLLFIPGGKVPNQHYVDTAASIQAAVAADLRLWVAIPAVFKRLCIISCSTASLCAPLHSAAEGALSLAASQGWTRGSDEKDIWLAGHSLGGVCANTLFQAYSSGSAFPYAGVILMGSYVDEAGGYDLVHYPKPVLVLNTELDGGLARPGKTSTWWRQHSALSEAQGEEYALTQKPVIVLPGLNHSDFCPGFDVPGDLPAEVDQRTATAAIAKVVAAFLRAQVAAAPARRASGVQLLREKAAWTRELLAPYLKAQEFERAAADVSASPEGASPFCAQAQHIVAGLSKADDARLEVRDGFHAASTGLEHCHPSWNATAKGGLSVHSCSHADYYIDIANTGSITAASEIACKMLSSARVGQQLNTTATRPAVPCSEGNRQAVRLAEALAARSTLDRFRRIGRGWCFEPDTPTLGNVGPVWVFHDALTLKENATCMSVSSPVLKTEIDGAIFPGSHYCKFLSPARVLDWMMTDGIKKFGSSAHEQAAGEIIVI